MATETKSGWVIGDGEGFAKTYTTGNGKTKWNKGKLEDAAFFATEKEALFHWRRNPKTLTSRYETVHVWKASVTVSETLEPVPLTERDTERIAKATERLREHDRRMTKGEIR